MSRLPAWLTGAATVLGLSAALVWAPGDECTASTSGGCVPAGESAFDTQGRLGETTRLADGTIEITRAAAGRSVAPGTSSEPARQAPAGGWYVAVELTAETFKQEEIVRAELTQGERSFEHVEAIGPDTSPGIPGSGWRLFLVPADALADDLAVVVRFGYGDAVRVSLRRLPRSEQLPAYELDPS